MCDLWIIIFAVIGWFSCDFALITLLYTVSVKYYHFHLNQQRNDSNPPLNNAENAV